MMAKATSPALPPSSTDTAACTRCQSWRPSRIAGSNDSIRPSTNTRSAATRAGSLPWATTPMPTVAARIAAASLEPSPTIAHTRPLCSSVCTICTLFSGVIRAKITRSATARSWSLRDRASHSAPLMTCSGLTCMPSSSAMAAAVIG
ncbi:Uncharacterised protein [Mycobacterium tuberculosis]|nr:Uncharacterised protein [Mycobacterium tuberculosis]